jgi:hypothetical protein
LGPFGCDIAASGDGKPILPFFRLGTGGGFGVVAMSRLRLWGLNNMLSRIPRRLPIPELTAKELQAQAAARLKRREEQQADAPIAMRQYREAEQAVLDRMAQLRAERLAREAAKAAR